MGAGAQAVIGPAPSEMTRKPTSMPREILEQVVGADGTAIVYARYGSGEVLQYFAFAQPVAAGRFPSSAPFPPPVSAAGRHQLCRCRLPFNSELQPP